MAHSESHIVWRPLQSIRGQADELSFRNRPDYSLRRTPELPAEVCLDVFKDIGVPTIPGAATALEYARGLLLVAAEVEHALLAQYLYAAGSIVDGPGTQYQATLRRIAVQEMGHLATVQNLLLLVGGPDAFYLQRDLLRRNSEENPIPFVLQGVTKGALAEFVAAEMPARCEIPDTIRPRVDDLVKRATAEAQNAVRRVGAIYALLKWIFMTEKDAEAWIPLKNTSLGAHLLPNPHIEDKNLHPVAEIKRYEATRAEWNGRASDLVFETCHNASEARQAISKIAAQGEGLDDTHDSHFWHFLDMANELDKGTDSKLVANPIARSPNLGNGTGGEGGIRISDPYTFLWGEVFAQQYGSMVLSILQAMRTPREGTAASRRAAISDNAITCMLMIIGQLAGVMGDLPITTGGQAKAGPPFDLDPALIQPASDEELAKRQLASLDRLETFYEKIEKSPEFGQHTDHASILATLRDFDKTKRTIFDPTTGPGIV